MKFITPPWPHQEKAINEAIELYQTAYGGPEEMRPKHFGYALFFEPRCGKTGAAINILRFVSNEQKARLRTLVFCPPRVVPNWKVEFGIHSKFAQEQIILLQGSGRRRLSQFTDASAAGAHIFVTNYEALLMPDLFRAFALWKPQFIIYDESHRLKEPGAKRSRLAEQLANPTEKVGKKSVPRDPPCKLILTGSPVLNSPKDIYQQFKILDGGETFSYYDYRTRQMEPLSYRGFMQTYFVDRNAGMPKQKYFPKWELKTWEQDRFDAMKEISEKISKKAMRIKRVDCLVLPPTSNVLIDVEMSQEQKRIYNEMKQHFITEYKSHPVVAKMALTKTIRLLQITSGFVRAEDTQQEIYLDSIPKQDALQELLEDILPTGKALVWSVFKENYRQIREVCERLGVEYVEVHGEISSSQQDKNVKRFQTDDNVRVFIGHPESGGEGINLVQAPYNIFYSRNHSLKHSIQASARNQSADSKHERTVRYDIVARGTLDQLVAELVIDKENMAEEVYAELVMKNLLKE